MKKLVIKIMDKAALPVGVPTLAMAFRISEENPSAIMMSPCKLVFVDTETGEEEDVEFVKSH